MLKGVDLNSAAAAEFERRFDGIGSHMAHRIVEDREKNGPFYDIYDLGRVPGISSRMFEKMTDRPWREDIYGQLSVVDLVLGKWEKGLPDLREIAARFQKVPGFEGCVIVHRDGDLIATSWDQESSKRMEALAPQIIKRVAQYMKNIGSGETISVAVFLDGRFLTFVQSEEICFVAVHTPKGLSQKHMQVAHGVGKMLGRRLMGLREVDRNAPPSPA